MYSVSRGRASNQPRTKWGGRGGTAIQFGVASRQHRTAGRSSCFRNGRTTWSVPPPGPNLVPPVGLVLFLWLSPRLLRLHFEFPSFIIKAIDHFDHFDHAHTPMLAPSATFCSTAGRGVSWSWWVRTWWRGWRVEGGGRGDARGVWWMRKRPEATECQHVAAVRLQCYTGTVAVQR